ncbi:MAG: hypothetical protein NVSMB19_25660 [Vulcanimicrobiaceae bacterium]
MEFKASPTSSERKRVLVADDDTDICTLLQVALLPHCDVVIVHDAETALDRISGGTRYDAIISDFMLPGLSGLDLIAKVRHAGATAHVPILMISGHGAFGIGAAATAAGADAYLDKPFTLAQLRATVLALLTPRLKFA